MRVGEGEGGGGGTEFLVENQIKKGRSNYNVFSAWVHTYMVHTYIYTGIYSIIQYPHCSAPSPYPQSSGEHYPTKEGLPKTWFQLVPNDGRARGCDLIHSTTYQVEHNRSILKRFRDRTEPDIRHPT